MLVAIPAFMMPAFTLALDAPTVRYEPLGDVATNTGVPVEVSLEALRLCNLAADQPDHFNLLLFLLCRQAVGASLADDRETHCTPSRRPKCDRISKSGLEDVWTDRLLW